MLKKDTLFGVLEPGLRWLFDTPQPDGAVVDPHGETVRADGFLFAFIPTAQGTEGLHGPTVAISALRDSSGPAERWTHVFTAQDVQNVWQVLDMLGYLVINQWNGLGFPTASFKLEGQAHPTLLEAVGRRNELDLESGRRGLSEPAPSPVPFVPMDRAAIESVELLRLHALEERGMVELTAARHKLRQARRGVGAIALPRPMAELRAALVEIGFEMLEEYSGCSTGAESVTIRRDFAHCAETYADQVLGTIHPLVGEMVLRMGDALVPEVTRR